MIALTFRRPVADARAYVCNGYGNYYQLRPGVWNYHPGIDIVFQEGSIAHAPVQSVAWGTVIYADRVTAPGFEVWGNLIVVWSKLPDDTSVFCRYAHVENMQVKEGDTVHPGQYLADVGNAYGQYAYHLDFSISLTYALAYCAWDWPGTDRDRVRRDYVDPCSFIRQRSAMPTDYTALDAALNNLQAATADMQAAVKAFETGPVELPGVEYVVNTDRLNVRPTPDTSQPPIATLLRGDVVRVIDATPSTWKQIVTGPYTGRYVSGAYLLPK